MQELMLDLRARGKLSEMGPSVLHMLYRNFIGWKQVKFVIFSRNLLFTIVNCLKSFDFKLFLVYTLQLLKGPFWQICT